MSADNYILIRKEDTQWVGYMQCASIEEDNYDNQLFRTEVLENAIIFAQEQDTEYGYRFEVDGLSRQSSSKLNMNGTSGIKVDSYGFST